MTTNFLYSSCTVLCLSEILFVYVSESSYDHWSKPVSDRGSVGGRNLPSGSRKILSSLDHQQQRVAEWLRSQEIIAGGDDKPLSQSLPRHMKRSQTETHSRRQHPTRTFSYIQAQVNIFINSVMCTSYNKLHTKISVNPHNSHAPYIQGGGGGVCYCPEHSVI